jgi:glycosyltransferase involved in cell wall biosynthesis
MSMVTRIGGSIVAAMSATREHDSDGRWLFVGVPSEGTSGGSLRAAHLPRSLIGRTNGHVLSSFGRRGLPQLALAVVADSGAWTRRLEVATSRLWPRPALGLLRGRVRGRLLDVHDQPVIQSDAFGIALSPAERDGLSAVFRANLDAFELLAVQTTAFADLCGIPPDRRLPAPNGTDSAAIQPGPMPQAPVIAMISGAAPHRGVELLIEAARFVREQEPDLQLRLGLAATGPASGRYVEALRQALAGERWTDLRSVPYPELSTFLASARALVIPHPPHPYYDAVLPVKLFDGMAAGRPTVSTPRHETAQLLTERDAGIVASSDRPEDLAQAIQSVLRDEERARQLGGNARRAAVEEFDWGVISDRLADAVLSRG